MNIKGTRMNEVMSSLRHAYDSGLLFAFGLVLCGMGLLVYGSTTHTVSALAYSEGSYGTCQYNTCSISIASNGSIGLAMTESTQYPTICSVGSDTLTVSTLSSTGYSVTVSVPGTDTNLTGVNYSATIPASSGTVASPALLTANTWGYRVDAGTFGIGPTTPLAGGAIPTPAFAGVPVASTPSYVVSSNSAATNAMTDVWFGVCIDGNTVAADVYENDVVYTAAVN